MRKSSRKDREREKTFISIFMIGLVLFIIGFSWMDQEYARYNDYRGYIVDKEVIIEDSEGILDAEGAEQIIEYVDAIPALGYEKFHVFIIEDSITYNICEIDVDRKLYEKKVIGDRITYRQKTEFLTGSVFSNRVVGEEE